MPGARLVLANLSDRLKTAGGMVCLTDLSPLSVCQGATDPTAVRQLATAAASRLIHLPRLHAKVYVADSRRAIVSSGNLTAGGLYDNYEIGIMIEDVAISSRIMTELSSYSELGARLDHAQLDRYCELAVQLRRTYDEERRILAEGATRALRAATDAVAEELIRVRLQEGPIHTVFAKTILYILEHHGRLSTEELHPLIERIHPDLCDNTVDRVIDGKRFGKKWKHAVRTAQQDLKQKGRIELVGGKWALRKSS